MKSVILILCVFACAFFAGADDGGSYRPEDWTYGNIYIEEPNEKIALEKELLLVNQIDGDVEARFGFRNTTDENVVVPCAFPVVIMLPFYLHENDGSVSPRVTFNAEPRPGIWEFLLKKEVEQPRSFDTAETYGGNITKDDVFALDEKLRTISCGDFLAELSRFGNGDAALRPCEIEQDGRRVPVKTVGIETLVLDGYESPFDSVEYGGNAYALRLVLHFYHELSFKAGATSKLTVRYKIDSEKKSYKGSRFLMQYDISTGGTWKNAEIGEFLVLTNSTMRVLYTKTDFEHSGFVVGGLYAAKNYKPQRHEYFEFSDAFGGDDTEFYDVLDWCGDEKRQSFVRNVRASSFLAGSYKIAGKSRDWEERNLDANLRESSYKPETSFDGNFYNGWVEGAKGDGIGEWIEFTLDSFALGPFATNGLRRFAWRRFDNPRSGDDKYFDFDWSECGGEYSALARSGGVGGSWILNNRVESMRLSNSRGKTLATLEFADLFPEFVNRWTNDKIAVNAVRNPLFLEKGSYRMTIESVYKGRKWSDTVLGEVWFVPVGDIAGGFLQRDADGFFRGTLYKMVEDFAAENVEKAENAMRSAEEEAGR